VNDSSAATALSTFSASATTSGPVPSPGMTAIRRFFFSDLLTMKNLTHDERVGYAALPILAAVSSPQ
jgi:hypothetical protein